MKRLMTTLSFACLLGMGTAAAQSGSTEKMEKDKMSKDKMNKPMMVTGCVEAGPETGHYMLSNGMMAGDTMGKAYALMGGDLKAHVGHKVEVTGTLDKKDAMGKMKAKDSMAKDDMKSSTLKVQSVKMLSDSCS